MSKAIYYQANSKNPRFRAPKYTYRKQEEFSVTEIVQSITNGLPIKSVDPDLYPYIYSPLKSKKTHLVQENNIYAACKVNEAINEINRYYYKKMKDEEARKQKELENEANEVNENTENEDTKFSQGDINEAVRLALNERYDQIDPNIYNDLTKELRKQQHRAIDQSNFQKAAVFDETARRVLVLDSEKRYNEITTSRVQEYTQKVQNLKTDISDLKTHRNEDLSLERKRQEDYINDLRVELAETIEDLDKKYDADLEDIPLKFKKFSSTYLNMRVQEKFLMKSKRYEEATAMKEQADKLKAEEEAQFKVKYQAYLDAKRNEIIRQAENQIAVNEELGNRRLSEIELKSNKEIECSRKALIHCSSQANEMEQLAAVANPTAPLSARSNTYKNDDKNTNGRPIPQSARAGPIRGSMKSVRKDRRSVKTVRDIRTPQEFSFERDSIDTFKQRRAINNIIYSRRGLPSIRKSAP